MQREVGHESVLARFKATESDPRHTDQPRLLRYHLDIAEGVEQPDVPPRQLQRRRLRSREQVLQRELPARVPQIALTKGWCGQAVVSSVWSLVFVVSSAVAVAPARPPTPGRELTGREPTTGRPLLR